MRGAGLGLAVLVAVTLAGAAAPASAVAPGGFPVTGPRLGPGDHGDDVRALQERLKALRFDPGPLDGAYQPDTVNAVRAFRMAYGLGMSAYTGPAVRRELAHPHRVRPLVRHGARSRAEVDLRRRILIVWHRGRVRLVTHVSTGSGRRYCVAHRCATARTPRGGFHVRRKIRGWRHSRLGWMYRPSYFTGGYAIHGSLTVPARPASHGCVRVEMDLADEVARLLPVGLPVYVR